MIEILNLDKTNYLKGLLIVAKKNNQLAKQEKNNQTLCLKIRFCP